MDDGRTGARWGEATGGWRKVGLVGEVWVIE